MALEVTLPKLGANIGRGIIEKWLKKEGDPVDVGTILCEFSIDKATVDIVSEGSGILKKILVREGQEVSLNTTIAVIAKADEDISNLPPKKEIVSLEFPKSEKREEYCEEEEYSILPEDGDRKCVLIGSGEYSAVIREILEIQNEVEIVGYLDDNKRIHGTKKEGLPILGGTDLLWDLPSKGVNFFILTIGTPLVRANLFKKALDAGMAPVSAIHPRSVISNSACISPGCVVEANTVLGVYVKLHRGVFICENCSISHDCVIDEFSHLAPGVSLGGGVLIKEGALVGVGASVAPHLTIGENSIVTPGTSVDKPVCPNVVYEGVPGKIIGKKSKKYRL